MSKRPARFTEADLFRHAKAAKRAGMIMETLPDGTIRLVPEEAMREPVIPVEPPPQPLL